MLDDYIFKSGTAKINASLKGNLKNPVIETNSVLKNFRIFIKSMNGEFYSPEISVNANPDNNQIKEILFNVKNSDFKINKYVLKMSDFNLKINENDIIIPKLPLNFEGISFSSDCLVKNYKSEAKEAKFNLEGKFPSNNKFISIKSNGAQTVNFNSKMTYKNNDININSFNLISNGKQAASFKGEIKNINRPEFNNISLSVPDKISVYSKEFDNTSFEIMGDALISGKIDNLNIDSNLKIYNLSYKPLNLYSKDMVINSKNSAFYINSTSSSINGSNFDFVANVSYKNKKAIFDFLQINSNYIDLAKIQNEYKKIDLNAFEIKEIKGNIQTVDLAGIDINSVNFDGSYKDSVLNIDNFSSYAYDGKIEGSGVFNLKTNKIKSDILLKDIALRKLLSEVNEIQKLSIAVSGHLSALIKSEVLISNSKMSDMNDLIKNTEAYIKFNIDNGELAQFAKLERFLQAGNILSQSILKLSLNSLVSVVTKQNTGDFKTIEGTVKVYNSKADIQYIKTAGTNMSLYIEGKLNLLSQYADFNVLGRIPSTIVNVLGSFGKFNTQQLVDKMSDDSKEVVNTITSSPIEKMFSTYVSSEEIAKIPSLTIQPASTREFKVNIFGNISDAKSINNFKWIIKN